MHARIKSNTKENITFEELTEEWLLYKKHQVKEFSHDRHKYIIEKYIICIDFMKKLLYNTINFNKSVLNI